MIDEFIGRLGTELKLTADEIADIFWLTHIRQQLGETLPAKRASPSIGSPFRGRDEDDSSHSDEPAHPSDGDDIGEGEPQPRDTRNEEIGVTSPQPSQPSTDIDTDAEGSQRQRIKLPDAPSLRDPLSLMRALRPLIQPVDTRDRCRLDEKATVQKIAEEQIWMPVTKPDKEPWLDLALVVDESNSMLIWRHTVLEIQRLLRYHGAFRDVRTWGLVWDAANQEMAIRPRFGVAASHLSTRRPHELLDPNGRRLVLVVTDCVAPYWQTQQVLTALEPWAKAGPVALLQMLPERMWPRTALRQASAVELLGPKEGMPNQQLRVFRQTIRGTIEEKHQELKLPVFSLEPELLTLWSRMVAGRGGGSAVGYMWESSGPAPIPSATAKLALSIDPEQRLKDFLRSSSPLAKRLTRLLAASPVITLPVIRLVQETLLPESNQVHVAEVLLGGLFEPATPPELGVNPDHVRYRFVDESLRDLLLEEASRVNTVMVLSRYISRMLGRTLSQFVAQWQTLGQREDQTKGDSELPFAVIAARVLKRQGRQYTEFVRQVETHYGVEILPGPLPEAEPEPRVIFPGVSGEGLRQNIAATFKPKHGLSSRKARDLVFNIDTISGQLSCLFTGYTISHGRRESRKPLTQGLNADRLWPRSKGGGDRVQGDLHITFPTRVEVNSARGNSPFCELAASDVHSWFSGEEQLSTPPSDPNRWGECSKVGSHGVEPRKQRGFEPRDAAKGIVARALFYAYTLYQDQLQHDYFEPQQETLLKWHQQFPPTQQERRRSRQVAESEQGNENPFVLDPTLAERIYGAVEEETPESPVEWQTDTVRVATVSELETIEFRVATVTVEDEEVEERLPLVPYTFEIGWVRPSKTGTVEREPGQGQQLIEDLGHGVSLEMVLIPGGEFLMGSPEDDSDASDAEKPQHSVSVPQFLMGKYPVTQAQWSVVARWEPVARELRELSPKSKEDNLPIAPLSWHDAVEFCQRLSRHTNRDYRLPSEAEWEYACRAGTTTPYHFGQQLVQAVANYRGSKTTEVGSFGVANAFGLYDLHGNVREWCADYWHENYQGAPTDGSAWLKGRYKNLRILRGGSWDYVAKNCRSAFRNWTFPDFSSKSGFRVCCSAPGT